MVSNKKLEVFTNLNPFYKWYSYKR